MGFRLFVTPPDQICLAWLIAKKVVDRHDDCHLTHDEMAWFEIAKRY